MRLKRVVGACLVALVTHLSGALAADPGARAELRSIISYLPHWVVRDGAVSSQLLDQLAPGTIVGAHHRWDIGTLSKILDYPDKLFGIAWYAEANLQEANDPCPIGTPVEARIAEARALQTELMKFYPAERFANMIELDGAREKKDGSLSGEGNSSADWLNDARAVQQAGFRFVAKSPTVAQLRELRDAFGEDFVQHIVFEDVTAQPTDVNRGYGDDAAALVSTEGRLTLIIHEGSYGGFPGTSLERARAVTSTTFARHNIEVYWGRSSAASGVVKLQSFASPN